MTPRSRRHDQSGFQRLRRVADSMTSTDYESVRLSYAAERAGDAEAALEWHLSVPMFRGSAHGTLLRQLVHLGTEQLPEWVWARWIFYQLTRCEDGDLGAEFDRFRQMFASSLHADLFEQCRAESGDPIRVSARTFGESWVLQQLLAHECDLLGDFLIDHATGQLAEHAEIALAWEGAAMGGYRLGESLPGARLRVHAAGRDRESFEILDLGAQACAGADGHVLGRLVPSGVGDLLMFDMPPLAVDANLAQEMAQEEFYWLRPLLRRLAAGATSADWLVKNHGLTTDVRQLDLLRLGTDPGQLPRVMEQLRGGRDEVPRAAYRVLRRAAEGSLPYSEQALLGAAAQIPDALKKARASIVPRTTRDVWTSWADKVAEPARSQLLALADLAPAAA